MARIPYIEPNGAPEETRRVFEQLPAPLNIFKLMAHAETSFAPLLRLGTSILAQQQLSGKLRELAILRVARLSHAEYEWVQHVPIAIGTGATEAQVAALQRDDAKADCFDETEKAVLQFTDEVLRDVGASDATFERLSKLLSAREIVELILAIGFYMTVARLMETLKIDLEPPMGGKIVETLARFR